MNPWKEFREWFFRTFHQTTGYKQDQEIGYPLQREINGVQKRQRFHSGDIPSQDLFEKLFESQLFKLNWEDRAKDSADTEYSQNGNVIAGHVTVATDAEAKANQNGDSTKYTRVPRTSQLPTVEDDLTDMTIAVNPTISTIAVNDGNGIEVEVDPAVTTRNNYLVRLTLAFINWVTIGFNRIKDYVDTVAIEDGEVTYNGTNTVTVTTTPAAAIGDTTNQFKLDVDVQDIQFANGNITGTIGGNAVSGITTVTETAPGSRTYQINITIND